MIVVPGCLTREMEPGDTFGRARGGGRQGTGWRRGRGGARWGPRGAEHQEGQRPNARDASRPQRPVRLGFRALLDLQDKDPNDIVLDLTSKRCFPATEELINKSMQMKDDIVILLVSILAKACDCDTQEYLFQLLNLLPRSPFLTLHLSSYINRLGRMTQADLDSQLKNMIKLFSELLRRYPNCYDDIPLAQLKCATEAIAINGLLSDEIIMREVERLMILKEEKVEELERAERERQERRGRPRGMDGKQYFVTRDHVFSDKGLENEGL